MRECARLLVVSALAFDFRANIDSIPRPMTKPLAIIHYERLMPDSQLLDRLQDLGYRVQTVAEATLLLDETDPLQHGIRRG